MTTSHVTCTAVFAVFVIFSSKFRCPHTLMLAVLFVLCILCCTGCIICENLFGRQDSAVSELVVNVKSLRNYIICEQVKVRMMQSMFHRSRNQ